MKLDGVGPVDNRPSTDKQTNIHEMDPNTDKDNIITEVETFFMFLFRFHQR